MKIPQDLDTMEQLREHLALDNKVGKHALVLPYRDKLLKIFYIYPLSSFDDLESFRWGDLPKEKGQPNKSCLLKDATLIQNICWLYGLAPRVYEIVGIEVDGQKYYAQLVDKVSGMPSYKSNLCEVKKVSSEQ